jgi:hypothetical protein
MFDFALLLPPLRLLLFALWPVPPRALALRPLELRPLALRPPALLPVLLRLLVLRLPVVARLLLCADLLVLLVLLFVFDARFI